MTQTLSAIKRAWKTTVPQGTEVAQVEVEGAGFELVEEDDVAFTLALCRQIHRIYGSYQDGSLPADEQVWAGLDLTIRTVSTLNSSVTSGMPSMRLQVATAQTREMLTVLFGQTPTRSLPTPAQAHQLAPAPGTGPARHPAVTSKFGPVPTETTRQEPYGRPMKERALAFWASRSLLAQVAAVVIGWLVTAALIDVPITALALFPNHFGVLAVSYLGVAAAIWLWRRRGVITRLRATPTPTLIPR